MKLWRAIFCLLLAGCAVGPQSADISNPLSLNKPLGGSAPREIFYAGGNAQPELVLPRVYHTGLAWSFIPNPGDEGRPVAFNVWASADVSVDLAKWDYVDTTTNTEYLAESIYPTDFYNVSTFFTDLTNQ